MDELWQNEYGFRKITLRDYEIYSDYTEVTSYFTGLWASNFTYIWSLSRKKNINVFYKIIDGMLVTFIRTKRNYMFLWCLPIGQGNADHVVKVLMKSLELCRDWNTQYNVTKKPIVYLLNELQLNFLKTSSYFDSFFILTGQKSKEIIWDISKVVERKGKEFQAVRYWLNRIEREYPSLQFRRFTPSDLKQVLFLKKRWNEASGKRYSRITDNHTFTQIFRHYQSLHELIFVATIDDRVVGVVTGEILPNKLAWGCIAKGLPEIKGIYEFLYTEFARNIQELNPEINLLLTGSDNNHEGLRTFKEKFNPVLKLKLYSLKLR
ncbi:phosphatidylglycerol lysyltransferase domain-containing protein [Bacillus dakarensis]|uniref:phosphatidylglycerol lysyltransferase domain-containing protein n=1 Tax=Robertmurraya dakarensis TaxID=1926278 RepID=UPI000982291B|nr:phosphatidylglycerol lysyltransferase domain-containing protein [Bacillus dakarensis]